MDFTTLLQAPQLISVTKKVYISDADGYFVDFSDKNEQLGTNRLLSFGSIDTIIDRTFRQFYNKTGNVIFRNNDRFFDKCFPDDPNKGWVLRRKDGTIANFNKSVNNIINIFASKDHPIRLRLASEIQLPGYAPIEFVLGTFLFTAITTDLGSTAEITTDSLIKILQKKSADTIKDGFNNWYKDIPVVFLIRKILEKAFGVYNLSTYQIEIPNSFIIPSFRDLTINFGSSQYSSLGRSPNQVDTNGDGEPDYFPNYGLIPRAMAYDSVTKILYCGLDNQIWKLNVNHNSASYTLWTFYSSLAAERYIEKLQIINGNLYIWSRDKWLHYGVEPYIEAYTTMSITDEMLRQKSEELRIKNLVSDIEHIVYNDIVYDTEFNYFPSIPSRYIINNLAFWDQWNYSSIFSICSFFGNINISTAYVQVDGWWEATRIYTDETYADTNQLKQMYSGEWHEKTSSWQGGKPQSWARAKDFFKRTYGSIDYFINTEYYGTRCWYARDTWYYVNRTSGYDPKTIINNFNYAQYPVDGSKATVTLTDHKLHNVNLPIPFKQRILVNCLGNKYYTGIHGSTKYNSIQFAKLKSYADSQDNESATLVEKGIDPGAPYTQRSAKEPSYELDAGYYCGVACRYLNTWGGLAYRLLNRDSYWWDEWGQTDDQYWEDESSSQAESFTSSYLDPIWGVEGLENTTHNDIKFTLGQKGVYGLFSRYGSSNPCQLRFKFHNFNFLHQQFMKGLLVGTSVVEGYFDYLRVFSALLNNIGSVKTGTYGTDVPYSILYLEEITPTTGALTVISTIKGLNYKGVEVQPVCICENDSTNYAWMFGYGVDNFNHFGGTMGDLSWADATAAYTNNYAGLALVDCNTIKQRQHYGFITKICTDAGGFYNYTMTSSIENNKVFDSTAYCIDTRFIVNTATDLSNLIGYVMNVTDSTNVWDLYIESVQNLGSNNWGLWYRAWGLRNNKIADYSKGYLPSGDFRGSNIKIVAKYFTPLSNQVVLEAIRYNNRIYAVIFDILQIGEAPYSIKYMDANNPIGFTTILTFPNQPKNFKLGASGKIYFTQEGNGKTAYLDLSSEIDLDVINSYIEMADGDYPINNEFFTHGDIELIDDAGESATIYGFSCPAHRDRTQAEIPIGEYNTWKLSTDYVPLIALADFTGMSCDQALDKLTESIFWTKGFDEFGNYFQMRKQLETTASLILEANSGNKFIKISKKIDYDSVANKISIIPYATNLQLPKYVVTELARKDKEKLNLTINIEQRDTGTKTVILKCIRDGALSIDYWAFTVTGGETEDFQYHVKYEDIEKAPLFAYNVVDPTIEGRILITASPASTLLYLDSVFGGNSVANGIKNNDYIQIIDSTNGTNIKKIISVDSTNNSISIESAFGFEIKATTIVQFLRTQSHFFSDVYVTQLSIGTDGNNVKIPVVSNANLGIGNIVEFVIDEMTTPRAIIQDKYTDSTGQDWIVVNTEQLLTADTVVKAYWSPMKSGTGYVVGGSGVLVKLTASVDANITSTDSYSFRKGESIVITCDGLKLEQDPYAMATYIDVESASIYGELEFQESIDNKFINRTLAKYLCKEIIDENATPKYELTCGLPYMPGLTPMADNKQELRKVKVISDALFPSHLDFSVNCGILDIKQQTDKRSTTVILRSENVLSRSSGGSLCITVIPTVLSFGSVEIDESSTLSYLISATGLSPASGSITITPPIRYQVSLSETTGFGDSLVLPYFGSALDSVTIYVRFTPTAKQNYNSILINAEPNGNEKYLYVEGTGSANSMGNNGILAIVSIQVTELTNNNVTILATTNRLTTAVMYYGLSSDALTNVAYSSIFTKSHYISLAHLIRNTTYYYKFVFTDTNDDILVSSIGAFTTTDLVLIWSIADNQLNPEFILEPKVRTILTFTPELLLTDDIVGTMNPDTDDSNSETEIENSIHTKVELDVEDSGGSGDIRYMKINDVLVYGSDIED